MRTLKYWNANGARNRACGCDLGLVLIWYNPLTGEWNLVQLKINEICVASIFSDVEIFSIPHSPPDKSI